MGAPQLFRELMADRWGTSVVPLALLSVAIASRTRAAKYLPLSMPAVAWICLEAGRFELHQDFGKWGPLRAWFGIFGPRLLGGATLLVAALVVGHALGKQMGRRDGALWGGLCVGPHAVATCVAASCLRSTGHAIAKAHFELSEAQKVQMVTTSITTSNTLLITGATLSVIACTGLAIRLLKNPTPKPAL